MAAGGSSLLRPHPRDRPTAPCRSCMAPLGAAAAARRRRCPSTSAWRPPADWLPCCRRRQRAGAWAARRPTRSSRAGWTRAPAAAPRSRLCTHACQVGRPAGCMGCSGAAVQRGDIRQPSLRLLHSLACGPWLCPALPHNPCHRSCCSRAEQVGDQRRRVRRRAAAHAPAGAGEPHGLRCGRALFGAMWLELAAAAAC